VSYPGRKYFAILTVAMLMALPQWASACTACAGASDSPLAWGMNAGIMTLLGVILSVLVGIVVFFVHVGRRSGQDASAAQPQIESKTEKN
jgi:heme/copper-type cytochrome/quinol oxidase subunit 2